jgi:hypothetical protein
MTSGSLVLLALEFGVFYICGAEFAPILGLPSVQRSMSQGVTRTTYCRLPVLRHGEVKNGDVQGSSKMWSWRRELGGRTAGGDSAAENHGVM